MVVEPKSKSVECSTYAHSWLPSATDERRATCERIGDYLQSRGRRIIQSVILTGSDTTSVPG